MTVSLSALRPSVSSTDSSSSSVTITVSAASVLSDVFPKVGRLWEEETGHQVAFNFGATGKLTQQIERGAPVDVFAAANRQFVEELERNDLVFSETKTLYGMGRITLWQRPDSPLEINQLEDLLKPEVTRVAIANPDTAPYGMAARQALQTAGIWEELQPKLILGENISQTQQYAMTGNVDVAIVALSLSVEKPGRWVMLAADLHDPIEQILVIPKNAPHLDLAKEFAAFVNGDQGRPLMDQYGFVLPDNQSTR